MIESIQSIQARNLARTPIADSLAAIAEDLKAANGKRLVVLVTDGEETCDGDPEAVIRELRDAGVDVRINIVGFAIDDPALAETFRSWAAQGRGRYFAAADEEGLKRAVEQALEEPFTVFDAAGSAVAEGVVDGEPIELGRGVYRVLVDGRSLPEVEIVGDHQVTLTVEETP
jgi:hypothetical protein